MRAAFQAGLSPDLRSGNWPAPLRWGLLLLLAVASALLSVRWGLQAELQSLHRLQAQEAQLREDYRDRLALVLPLATLRQRRLALVAQGLAPWPDPDDPARTQAWMETLLTEIHRAGQGRRLRFELFRPGPAVVRPYYVEWPITLRVVGHYHDIGAFAAELARQPRLVTLERLALSPRAGAGEADGEGGSLLTLDAVARAYRARRPEEGPAPAKGPASGSRP